MTGPANFGPEMATSAVAAFGPAGAMFVTLNVSGKFPFSVRLPQLVVGNVALVRADAVFDQIVLGRVRNAGIGSLDAQAGQLVGRRQDCPGGGGTGPAAAAPDGGQLHLGHGRCEQK